MTACLPFERRIYGVVQSCCPKLVSVAGVCLWASSTFHTRLSSPLHNITLSSRHHRASPEVLQDLVVAHLDVCCQHLSIPLSTSRPQLSELHTSQPLRHDAVLPSEYRHPEGRSRLGSQPPDDHVGCWILSCKYSPITGLARSSTSVAPGGQFSFWTL